MLEVFRYDDIIVGSENIQRTLLRHWPQAHGYHMATDNVAITY